MEKRTQGLEDVEDRRFTPRATLVGGQREKERERERNQKREGMQKKQEKEGHNRVRERERERMRERMREADEIQRDREKKLERETGREREREREQGKREKERKTERRRKRGMDRGREEERKIEFKYHRFTCIGLKLVGRVYILGRSVSPQNRQKKTMQMRGPLLEYCTSHSCNAHLFMSLHIAVTYYMNRYCKLDLVSQWLL